MRVFEDITLDYRVIGAKAYPRIRIDGLISLPDFEDNPNNIFYLHKFRISRTNPQFEDILADIGITGNQVMIYCMNDYTYMSVSLYMLGDGYLLQEDTPVLNISSFFINSQYNIVDMETDLENEVYIYRITGYYNGKEYNSKYVAGIKHVNIETEDLDYIGPTDVGITPPMDMGLGNLFASDSVYTTDKEKRIYIKGLSVPVTTPRYRGPLDHTCEKSARGSIVRGLEFIESIYTTIDERISEQLGVLNDIITELSDNYRSL